MGRPCSTAQNFSFVVPYRRACMHKASARFHGSNCGFWVVVDQKRSGENQDSRGAKTQQNSHPLARSLRSPEEG